MVLPINERWLQTNSYGVDSGGIGIFPMRYEELHATFRDREGEIGHGLNRVYKHTPTGKFFTQMYGPEPQVGKGFFSWAVPHEELGGRSMNDVQAAGELEYVEKDAPSLPVLSYAMFSWATCNTTDSRQLFEKKNVFYSSTTWGDGGYEIYTRGHSGVLVVTTDSENYSDGKIKRLTKLGSKPLGKITVKDGVIVVIDPCYIKDGDSGLGAEIGGLKKGSYTLSVVNNPDMDGKDDRPLFGYLLTHDTKQ